MRQTSAEIDHAILDVAAGIFATYGFRHTSVQQVADAVGYSKPGLLHRFGSKEALHQAVLAEVAGTVEAILSHAGSRRGRPEQVEDVLGLLAHSSLARPGVALLVLESFQASGEEQAAGGGAGDRLVAALDHPLTAPADRLRLGLALGLVVAGARS